jgi:hypothetical protein
MDPNATHVWVYYARKIRIERIRTRRAINARARSRGFRNYAQMCGEEAL